jgi:hypothetical protein
MNKLLETLKRTRSITNLAIRKDVLKAESELLMTECRLLTGIALDNIDNEDVLLYLESRLSEIGTRLYELRSLGEVLKDEAQILYDDAKSRKKISDLINNVSKN